MEQIEPHLSVAFGLFDTNTCAQIWFTLCNCFGCLFVVFKKDTDS